MNRLWFAKPQRAAIAVTVGVVTVLDRGDAARARARAQHLADWAAGHADQAVAAHDAARRAVDRLALRLGAAAPGDRPVDRPANISWATPKPQVVDQPALPRPPRDGVGGPAGDRGGRAQRAAPCRPGFTRRGCCARRRGPGPP
ncbi:hypothetical protein [Dactylosporangium sp. NPDC049140]|uniref:hypothetical protein n=1 Tax=Dactylosporangium sp. NPDC049140 TaxID=3155647 RepID=UPI00340D86ED